MRFNKRWSLIVLLTLLARANSSPIELAVDTAVLNQDGLLVIYGGVRLGGEKGLPVGAGDINGDGRADVIFCQLYASVGGNRRNNGQVNFYLSDGRSSGIVDSAQNPPSIKVLIGADSGDLLGTSLAAGDINGDGFSDVLIGAAGDDGPANSRFNAGAAYLVFGSSQFDLRADLSTPNGIPPSGMSVIYGAQVNGRCGIWVDVGDLDGDGFADMVIGADQLGSDAGEHVGGAYIIFGSRSLPQVIDLASPPAGIRVTRILGASEEDHWGSSLHVGDVNSDQIADLSIAAAIFRDSASYVTPEDQTSGHDAKGASFGGQRPRCGEVYVLYGSPRWPSEIDLRRPPSNSTHIIGAKAMDFLGSQMHSGDINGDGRRDLVIGALQAEAPDGRGRTGAVYVIYSDQRLPGATIDLADPNGSGFRITTIYGEDNLDCAGDSVRTFDVNRDGFSDLFIGSPEHSFEVNGQEREEAGDTKIIVGRPDLPAIIKLYDPPENMHIFRLAGADGEAQGLEGGDEFSYRLAVGDVDGDGFPDYIANAMHGDGFNNSLVNAGEVYVFSGKVLSERLGLLSSAPILSSATLSVGDRVVVEAEAGQSGLRVTVRGSNFRTDTEILINGAVVLARLPSPPLDLTERIVELDDNPSVRNRVGVLVVRARNTDPPSELSNSVIAGRLLGPQIASISARRKPSGIIIMNISGSAFQEGLTAAITVLDVGRLIVRPAGFISSDSLRVKIKSDIPPPGSRLRVRLETASGVQSNEIEISAP